MVLAHYGRACTEAEVRQLLGTGPHGTPARALLQLATLGLEVQLRTSNSAQLAASLAAGVPPIVFLETSFLDCWHLQVDHVAVLVGLDAATVSLNDPYFDAALQQTSLSGFLQAWAVNQHLAAFIRPRP
jgi:ABC-type bacteriocin/lantibiotic exporter with double-glycine peptidase domain